MPKQVWAIHSLGKSSSSGVAAIGVVRMEPGYSQKFVQSSNDCTTGSKEYSGFFVSSSLPLKTAPLMAASHISENTVII
jgi:hypothetical protein